MEKKHLKAIISGGGTGGHIFPAVSIANALGEIYPEVEILFVGAEGKMEMEKVPAAGYDIVGLPVVGFHRKLTLRNLSFPFKLLRSLQKAKGVVKSFNPDVVVGVGGYASGPVLRIAQQLGIPTLIQEQNSFAGVTNKLLAKKAKAICVAYEGMEKYFPASKIILTGNPIRQGLEKIIPKTDEAHNFFDVPKGNKVVLVVGGSLGARSINHSILGDIDKFIEAKGVTLIWQTGKFYINDIKQKLNDKNTENIKVFDFINRMDLAYSIADLVISRAGACTISELCMVGKPSILVPSPNVAEDHQTMNAQALATRNAAILVKDSVAPEALATTALEIINDEQRLKTLSINIKEMALPNAANDIASKVIEVAGRRQQGV
ncbi:undecaprenyldiphospho-muramoylpentapeptide beta-N-acetylglucosaminyltransferase [Perlabentimonas gracilis]|uniref:undecaprenyldiphospho-muramoylpentapeptide beta-N-acetylglucosaminyltransferase n=1 Tax=Perlabentimonas gracilis TaxID=2715279 RepID=UPI001408C9B1|nr:undecaprenyldiphospho-muramoylpentapeptide beta-N-acetylglucosaminyltransferase [Perlabentimonas gracilis]NHB68342.1 undecaprenyldiphospho-muramoylpentapeptide beta-N-acetylglucosaminyltransferase [Perlabentimonas gracilis]